MKKMVKREMAKVVEEDFSSEFKIISRRRNRALMAVKKFDINGPRSTWPDAFDWLCKMAIKFKRLDEKFGPHAEH